MLTKLVSQDIIVARVRQLRARSSRPLSYKMLNLYFRFLQMTGKNDLPT